MDRIRNTDTDSKESFWSRFQNKFAVPLIVCLIIIVITVTLIVILVGYRKSETLSPPRDDIIECPGLDESNCSASGCYWQKMSSGPSCFMQENSFGYTVEKIKERENGIEIELRSADPNTPYGPAIEKVIFNLTYITENILRFQFTDENAERYEVPIQNNFPLQMNLQNINKENTTYIIEYTKEYDFHFSVKRRTEDARNLWDTAIGGLLLSDKYLQIASYLPSSYIYGLGEHVHDSLKHEVNFKSWPMFARDRFPSSFAGHQNLYGVHPFYTCLEEDGKSHGVLFLNSNAMEATLLPAPAISFRTIGGILDFFIFIGDNPEHVIQLYTSLIGRPMMPPYWSLGFQLSRYGYNSLSNMQKVLNRTREARIPQAVQHLDIDHMSERKDFTYDSETFPELPEFMRKQREKHGLKWIVILDPAIPAFDDYEPWTSGRDNDIFVRRGKNWPKSLFPKAVRMYNITFGKVWPPAYAAFPDFFQDRTKKWWKEHIVKHYEENDITFDGLWIDMNEPANFETNVENASYCKDKEFEGTDCRGLLCPKSPYEDPPYNPVWKITGDRLSEKTICMDSIHNVNGTYYRHYFVHSLYGWSQSQPTLEAAQEATGTRSLVISRSTYPSSGRYSGHWLGDNTSNFKNMKNSIIGMLEFNMFGIPYIGADVCGFAGKANAELCKRWMQLGAFYPFYRNHNAIGEPDQDPAYFGEDVAEASRKAVERRIALNPYLYTLFYRAHVDGNTVVRPVFHEFPQDKNTWEIDEEFMWGKSLLIAPVLHKDMKNVSVYLPKGEWWLFLYEKTKKEKFTQNYMLETQTDEYTPMYVRGGTILPIAVYDWESYPEKDNVMTRKMDLYVFPEEGKAEGELFMDDGLSQNTIENDAYALYNFTLEKDNCTLNIVSDEKKNFQGPYPHLNKILIFKVKSVNATSDKHTIKFDEERNILQVIIDKKMSELKKLTWVDENDECSMLK